MIKFLSFALSTLGLLSITSCGDTANNLKSGTSSNLASHGGGGTGTCAVKNQKAVMATAIVEICQDDGLTTNSEVAFDHQIEEVESLDCSK